MCTSITLHSRDNTHLIARTMDFSFELEPEMTVIPRNHPLEFKGNSEHCTTHYAFMGLSKNIGKRLFADGVNEKGLTGMALYFEGYAHYASTSDVSYMVPEEVVMIALATCSTIEDIKTLFDTYPIVGETLAFLGTTPPLHWVFQDETGASIIVEPCVDGVHFHENTLGVLTNSPNYEWHYTNIRNYIGLQPEQVSEHVIYGQTFKAFGQGSGTFGLPGDLTPPSRFIRTLYNKLSAQKANNEQELVLQALHILNNVDIPKGSVVTPRNTIDYTQYTAYILNVSRCYIYRMYNDLTVYTVHLEDFEWDTDQLVII